MIYIYSLLMILLGLCITTFVWMTPGNQAVLGCIGGFFLGHGLAMFAIATRKKAI